MTSEHTWWHKGVVYQIYPRSYQDTNGDGVGDLAGIRQRLDYIASLGVDALWISPIYPSPMADFGYDVADYVGIDPLFGTMDDFDALVADAHARGLKIILDFVPNHTSDEHPWFVESRSSRENPKRDWYLWRDPAPDGGPPTNWRSVFGGPAWTFDEKTGQFYYHGFLSRQPDLNWRNPEVRAAMMDVLRFWLDCGVDGFRVDVIWHLIKSEELIDNPLNPAFQPGQSPYDELAPIYTVDRPEVHEIIREMRSVLAGYDGDRLLIGEIYLPLERLVAYYGEDGEGVHLPYNFQLVVLPWNARAIAAAIERYEALLPAKGWPNWVLGNHDKPRIASRVGIEQARVAAMLLMTLRGTPTIYYGDELGMHDVAIPPDRVQDPFERNVPGLGFGRDPNRTPMQWDTSANAGFSIAEPWLPIAEDYREVNVAVEERDARSMLTLHRRLASLRREHHALHAGGYASLPAEGDLIAFTRETFLIVLNLGPNDATYPLPDAAATIVLSTHLDREGERVRGNVALRANEAVILRREDAEESQTTRTARSA